MSEDRWTGRNRTPCLSPSRPPHIITNNKGDQLPYSLDDRSRGSSLRNGLNVAGSSRHLSWSHVECSADSCRILPKFQFLARSLPSSCKFLSEAIRRMYRSLISSRYLCISSSRRKTASATPASYSQTSSSDHLLVRYTA